MTGCLLNNLQCYFWECLVRGDEQATHLKRFVSFEEATFNVVGVANDVMGGDFVV